MELWMRDAAHVRGEVMEEASESTNRMLMYEKKARPIRT